MTPFPILLTAVFLGSGNGSSHIVHGSLFPPIATSMFEKFNPTIVRRAVSYALTMCSIKWLFSRSMFISFDLVKQRRGILQCLSTQQRLLSVFTTRNEDDDLSTPHKYPASRTERHGLVSYVQRSSVTSSDSN